MYTEKENFSWMRLLEGSKCREEDVKMGLRKEGSENMNWAEVTQCKL
jgi:hypothetical protein